MWVTGRHPVEELLASATQRARKVLLSDAIPKEVRAGFEKRAKELALPCLTCPRQEWERRTGEREGGGIAAEIAEYAYAGMEEWVSALPGDGEGVPARRDHRSRGTSGRSCAARGRSPSTAWSSRPTGRAR